MKPINVGGLLRNLPKNKNVLFAICLGEILTPQVDDDGEPVLDTDGKPVLELEDVYEYISVPRTIAREAVNAGKDLEDDIREETGKKIDLKMAGYIDEDGDLIIGEFDPNEPEEEIAVAAEGAAEEEEESEEDADEDSEEEDADEEEIDEDSVGDGAT